MIFARYTSVINIFSICSINTKFCHGKLETNFSVNLIHWSTSVETGINIQVRNWNILSDSFHISGNILEAKISGLTEHKLINVQVMITLLFYCFASGKSGEAARRLESSRLLINRVLKEQFKAWILLLCARRFDDDFRSPEGKGCQLSWSSLAISQRKPAYELFMNLKTT